MAETEQENKVRSFHSLRWNWLLGILIHPRKTISNILVEEKANWQTPLLVLTVLVILAVVVEAPIQRVIIQSGAEIPENFQYWSTEQQNAFMQSQAMQTSPLFLYVFPILTRIAGFWLIWFLMSSILHLSITLFGSRSSRQQVSNLVAWTMTPLALRLLVEIIVVLTTQRLIENRGLSSLIASDAEGFSVFLRGILANIDLYYVWHLILLLVGAVPLSGLSKSKANEATLIAAITMLLLMAVPALLSSVLSGLSTSSGFYFF
jgi:hypothetical protein